MRSNRLRLGAEGRLLLFYVPGCDKQSGKTDENERVLKQIRKRYVSHAAALLSTVGLRGQEAPPSGTEGQINCHGWQRHGQCSTKFEEIQPFCDLMEQGGAAKFCDFHSPVHSRRAVLKGLLPEQGGFPKFFQKFLRFCLTKRQECCILTWCVNAHAAMKREIADVSPVTSVEYVRTGFGRLFFSAERGQQVRCALRTADFASAFLVGWHDTRGLVEKNTAPQRFGSCTNNVRNLGGTHHG